MSIQLAYDEAKKEGVLRFPNGRELTIGNVTREQADRFLEKHAPEFERRDGVLHTADRVGAAKVVK